MAQNGVVPAELQNQLKLKRFVDRISVDVRHRTDEDDLKGLSHWKYGGTSNTRKMAKLEALLSFLDLPSGAAQLYF